MAAARSAARLKGLCSMLEEGTLYELADATPLSRGRLKRQAGQRFLETTGGSGAFGLQDLHRPHVDLSGRVDDELQQDFGAEARRGRASRPRLDRSLDLEFEVHGTRRIATGGGTLRRRARRAGSYDADRTRLRARARRGARRGKTAENRDGEKKIGSHWLQPKAQCRGRQVAATS
jgi:hypothetical protein